MNCTQLWAQVFVGGLGWAEKGANVGCAHRVDGGGFGAWAPLGNARLQGSGLRTSPSDPCGPAERRGVLGRGSR